MGFPYVDSIRCISDVSGHCGMGKELSRKADLPFCDGLGPP